MKLIINLVDEHDVNLREIETHIITVPNTDGTIDVIMPTDFEKHLEEECYEALNPKSL